MVLQLVLGCLRRRKLPQQAPSFVLVHVLEMLVDILLIVALTFPTHVLEMQMVILTSVALAFLTAPYFLIRNSGNLILKGLLILGNPGRNFLGAVDLGIGLRSSRYTCNVESLGET